MAGAWLGASPVCLGGRASPRSRRLRALGLGSLGAGLASAPALRRRGARAAASSEGGDRRSGETKKTMGRPAEGGVSVGDSMMAGAFAGMLSRVAVAPLDVIKIRMQVQVEPVGPRRGALGAGKYRGIAQCARTILKEEGARGLWAGTVPALFLWVPYTAVQFAALGEFKRVARENGGDPEKPPLAFAGGAVAGATATVVTYPFDVMRTVLAAQGSPRVYESLPAAAAGILKSRGPAGLYAGVGVTLLEIVPASAIQFGVYALLRDIARGEDPRSRDSTPRAVTPLANAACGFGAGSVARVIIHPLDVVKKRFQVAGLARSLRYGERVAAAEFSSFASAVGTILRKEGVRGFYKGLTPGLIKSAPASAITFAAYEAASRFVATARRRAEEGSGGGSGARDEVGTRG
jgi:solute carrier family 25 thiamine pyrophosphate transporter 19